MPPLEYAKAFLLTFVFFGAALVFYLLAVPTAEPFQVAVLLAVSLYFTHRRVALLNIMETTLQHEDEPGFLALVDQYLNLKDRWQLVEERDGYRRYEAPLTHGLYRFTGRLEVTLGFQQATLAGHERIVRPIVRELSGPRITTLGLQQR